MLRRQSVNYAILSMALDLVLTLFALWFAGILRPFLPETFPFIVLVSEITFPTVLYLIIAVIWGVTFAASSVYDPQRNYKIADEFQSVMSATAISTLIFAGVLYLGFRDFSRWLLFTFVVLDVFCLLGWRLVARIIFRTKRMPNTVRKVLIVGAGKTGSRIGRMVEEYHWAGLKLTGYLDDDAEKRETDMRILGKVRDVRIVVEKHNIDDVVVALPQRAYGQVNKLVLDLTDLPVHVRVVPDYFSLALYRATVEDFSGIPMINLRDPALNDVQRMLKRMFDLGLGGLVAVLISPLLFFIALLVKLDSPGPIFFRQERIGENGRLFGMYKFRTMVLNADQMLAQVTQVSKDGKILFKYPDDPRITRVGRILRRISIDEIPQLLNVLKGDMSLVGPRPELPWLVEKYEPWQHKRFAVPQGMTGWWQVNGRSDKPMHLHTEDDLYYVQNYSLWMDIYILLKTPWIVLRGKGAY